MSGLPSEKGTYHARMMNVFPHNMKIYAMPSLGLCTEKNSTFHTRRNSFTFLGITTSLEDCVGDAVGDGAGVGV